MSGILTLRAFRVDDGADGPSDVPYAQALRNADMRRVHESTAYDVTLAEVRDAWTDDADYRNRGVVAERGGEVVGTASASFALDEGAASAGVNVRIRADDRRTGVGARLLAEVEALAAAEGRTTFQCWTEHAARSDARVDARSGWGSVPDDATSRFATAHGYTLEQVYRNSRLDLGAATDTVAALLDEARRAAANDYTYQWWETPTPTQNAADIAQLHARMSTDAPSAGIEEDESFWDAERLARWEESSRVAGYRKIIGAARHRSSGRIVAFNELSVRGDEPVAHQNDTLVLREHRGHRLGMLVKCETLGRLRELFPAVERIETYNAEENRPMLAINEAMGFTPVLYSGMWQKKVPR